jgi:plasmid stabilization system protein ParE
MAKGKKYRVVIALEARNDLHKELSYISENASVQTARYVNKGIQDVLSKLSYMPERHPRLHRISSEERIYRFVPKWSYIIIFRVEEAIRQVRVVSIFNARQAPNKLDDIKDK